ncbi:MAG TPA: tRNA (N6-isopentenyl adenosine(37)-C2)-methylthiotransferase MiaB [archaeon]|nr:tRNA (N6-isopentenyl adenosine(37)-C2)-methylthiotransferase MiaB [archaeon]
MGFPRTYYLETYGCQMNLADSELIESQLVAIGIRPVFQENEADLILVNTCGVREHAEQRVLSRLGTLKRHKRKNPAGLLVVCGCMAQRMGESLFGQAPWVDLAVGPDNYRRLPELISDLAGGQSRQAAALDFYPCETYDNLLPRRRELSSAWVPIMRGCNNYCSYCIVPYVRGAERSVDPAVLEDQVRRYAAEGALEVVLLGQNVNSYSYGDTGFAQLLRRLERIGGLRWIRFITSHPRDLSDAIIESMADCSKICEHLHLPVQSGSDRVLGLMNRGYGRDYYLERVGLLRRKIPDLALTTDILVGFPGETIKDYEDTVSLMQEVSFDYAYTYKYSTRPGTAAEKLEDSVTEEEKGRRLAGVIELQRAHTRAALDRLSGRGMEVLLTAPAKSGQGKFLGKTRTHFNMILPASESLLGRIVRARVTGNTGMSLLGERIA